MANMTKRDSALIKKIAELGMLSTKQIGEFFFEGVDIRTVLRRLRKLEVSNLLRRMVGLDTKECLWLVTATGAESSSVEIFKTKWSKNMIEHDYKLISLRLLLEGAGIARSWMPEHEIRSQVFRKYGMRETKNKLIPDGLIGVLVNNKMESVAIELELTLKDKRRYRNIFNQYQDKKNLYAVWYIVPTNSILKSLKESWKKNYSSYSGINAYFSILADVMGNPLEAKLIGSNSVFKLSELFLPMEISPAHLPAHEVSRLAQSNLQNKMQLTSEIHTPILGFNN
jgi:hypothetical protein